MNTFLFELGTEEIPAGMIESALQEMEACFCKRLKEAGIDWSQQHRYASPRRLTVHLEGLPEFEPDREEILQGPPRSVALDSEGRPTAAGTGFARKMGVEFEELKLVETERGEYLALSRVVEGRPVKEILVEIAAAAIELLRWPKNMYWRSSRFRFIRPLRWFVMLWNGEILDFEFEGVRAGRMSRGHRYLGNPEVPIDHPQVYLDRLRRNYVLADVAERRAKIETELKEETPAGLQVRPDPELMDLVCYLNEYPTVMLGSFEQRFLEIPQEVLITVMRHHQKYFALVDSRNQIQPYFLTVLNTRGDESGKIRQGHERVLTARLEDGAFFWRNDRQRSLSSRVPDLANVVFQQDLGTYLDKTERLEAACKELGADQNLLQAAHLCKADLTTEMVFEMPELQGIMGGLHAREEGLEEEVWRPIYEHYRPASQEDESPSSRGGALLSIADKMDTIVGCFQVGIEPTGSGDPFALRRQAQGVVRVLLDHHLPFRLSELIAIAQKTLGDRREEVTQTVTEFMQRRVRFIFQESGLRYDVVNALFAASVDSVYDAFQRGQALRDILGDEDFDALASAFKRIRNILKQQDEELQPLQESRLVEPSEKSLYREFQTLKPEIDRSVKQRDYSGALRRLASLRQVVDRFFDDVMVMTEDAELRRNRLRLLSDISATFLGIADISEIVIRD